MEYHLKNPNWQRGDSNMRRQFQSTALLSTRPSASLKKEASVPEISNYCTILVPLELQQS